MTVTCNAGMEFDFIVPGLTSQQFSVWDAAALRRLSGEEADNFKRVVEVFGKKSAQAQGLKAAITDIYRLRGTDQKLYLAASRHNGRTLVLGGLKVGRKKLWVNKVGGSLEEVEPMCVLDFYVHEGYQRQGIGKQIFEHFLACEGIQASQLAYDRPSNKLLTFLSRHYGLQDYLPQNNNFVLFDSFWAHLVPRSGKVQGRWPAHHAPTEPPMHPHAEVPQPPPAAASPLPPWVMGLPPASRPSMHPSTAYLPASNTNSPAATLHPPPTTSGSLVSPGAAGPPLGRLWEQAQAEHHPGVALMGAQGGGAEDMGRAGEHLAQPAIQTQDQAGTSYQRIPSFGRRSSQTAVPDVHAHAAPRPVQGYRHDIQGLTQGVPQPRGDTLDHFRAAVSVDTPGLMHAGGVGSGVGVHAYDSKPWGETPRLVGSLYTPQGPAHLYHPVAAPAIGVSQGTGLNSRHGPLQCAQQAGGAQAGMVQTAVGAHQAERAWVGGPRFTTPPWGVEGDASDPYLRSAHAHSTQGTRSSQGPGDAKAGPATSAREAALAARAGRGAAGCLAW